MMRHPDGVENEPLTNVDIALNEASWLSLAFNTADRRVTLCFDVLTLPDGLGGEGHELVTMSLNSVGRIVASLRLGRWDDERAEIVRLELAELPAIVESFGASPVYGWEFFDLPGPSWEPWRLRLSLDERWADGAGAHSVNLFQEGRREAQDRHLDVRIWFDELAVSNEAGKEIPLPEFASGGKRWWDALRTGDDRVRGFGIVPGRS
jgi:hypothetical protein